jgi:Uncharacterized protein conserved in bacteria (DUF2321)
MALSDSCFEFLHAVAEAASALANDVHWYANPDYPIQYGAEIDALRRACSSFAEAPYDPEAGVRLMRLAGAVMRFHDSPPDAPEAAQREGDMRKLIALLQKELDGEEAEGVPAVIENIAAESPYTERAAKRLKSWLPKLGKSAYDIAVKVISDVGSATAKKILGL